MKKVKERKNEGRQAMIWRTKSNKQEAQERDVFTCRARGVRPKEEDEWDVGLLQR